MTTEEIIKKYKQYITNQQIKGLVEASERYKNLNAGNRASMQTQLNTQYRQARRGLQNMGLASRQGKVISGREQAISDAVTRSYGEYNRALQGVEQAQVEQLAVKDANATIRARRKAAEEAAKAELLKQQAMQVAANVQGNTNLVQPDKANAAVQNVFDKLKTQKPTTQIAQQQPTVKTGMTSWDNLKDTIRSRKQNAIDYVQKNIDDPSVRFGAEYGVNTTPEAAQNFYDKKQVVENAAWKNEPDKAKATKEEATAISDMNRAYVAAQYPQYANLISIPDWQFDTQYDAVKQRAERLMAQAKQERNAWATTSVTARSGYAEKEQHRQRAEQFEKQAQEMLAPWEQAQYLRDGTGAAPSLASTINVPEKDMTKDKRYTDTTEFVRDNQRNWDAVSWASPSEWNGDNWKTAKEKGWSASDYKGKSKYDALINEWAYINGRTALLYTQKFNTVQSLGNFKDLFTDDVTRNNAYNWFRDECMKAFGSMDGNVGRFKEKYGYKSEREQMDAMLTLANLMTDEERARFNGMLNQYGAEYADEYFEYLYNDVLPQRMVQYTQGQMAFDTRTAGGRIGQSLMSVPTNIANGWSGVVDTMTTKQTDPVAAQLGAMKYNTAQTMREAVGSHYGEFGNFLYQTTMSMADSATVGMISGGLGNLFTGMGVPAKLAGKAGSLIGGSILGASAFNSIYQEALERGLSPEKARAVAFGNGVNEMLFESLSLDLLVSRFKTGDMLKVSKNGFVNWFVNTLVQGGVEGSEEVFTDMANNLWDKQINGIYSEELTKLREYIAQGMSYDEAKRKVDAEYAEQLGMSFLGGALSGGVMGGAAGAMYNINNSDYERIGNNMDAATKTELDNFKFKDKQAQEIQQQRKKTNQDYGVLAVIRAQETMQTDPMSAYKAVQSILDTQTRTELKVDKRNQTLKTGTENSVSFNYDGVTDVKKMSGVQVEALRFAQTLVKSKVGGVNINVANQLYDKNGNEQNGWYDPKTNTVHVSLNGSQSVVYTISHELTHRLKEGNKEAYASLRDAMKSELESLDLLGSDLPEDYSDILGDYLVKDGVQRTAWEALIDYEMDRYAKHDIKLDREAAEEEVVCRACETMLEKSRLISSMVSRNVRGAKKIAKLLASIGDDILALKAEAESRGYEDGSPEKMFIDQYANIEKIANAWASAMKTVSQEEKKNAKKARQVKQHGQKFSIKEGKKLFVSPMSNAVSSEANVRFSVREETAPTKTRDVYKLMRLGKDGRLYPLFIDSEDSKGKYSLKVGTDSLGKEYLKYLQLGAKVVTQTATEAEIKEFKQRMVQLSEDNRAAFLDKLREKLIRDDEAAKVREVRDRQLAAQKEKYEEKLDKQDITARMYEGRVAAEARRAADERVAKAREVRDRQIARLKAEFRESREKAREARFRRDIVNVLKNGNDRIVKLLANPTENAHVPVQLAQAVAEYAQRLNELLTTSVPMSGENAGIEKQTKKGELNARKIIDALNRSYADEETIAAMKAEDPHFDPRGLLPVQYDESGHIIKDETLVKMIEGMDEIIQGKHLTDLTTEELQFVLNTMRGVIHTVTDANKVTVDGEKRNVYRTSRKMANEINNAAKVFGNKSNKLTKFLNRYVIESLGLRRIAKLYSGSDENAIFVKMVDDLNQGALDQERIKQTLRGMFNEVTSKYAKDMETWYGKKAEWIDTGFGFKITKGMRVSLAMHILNAQNLRNVEKAGLRIPEMSAYRKGNIKEAYKNGKVVRLTKEQAEQIVSNMTEAEKAYYEVAKEFFHKRSGYYINKTSLKLLGYSKAIVENYFPIQTDDAYRTVKYDDVRQNASVEHPGFLETRKGTANVMYLNDITAVVNRQIDGVAKYAGLAIPMRNWNNIMNAWLFEENEDGEWVRSDDGRAHDVLERRMGYTNGKGKAIIDYVDQFITDLTSPGMRDANENVQAAEFAARITSNYVKAVLTLNARVALSQLASVPTAAAEIPWKYLVQSFGGNVEQHLNRNASNELIDQYTAIFAMRRAGTQTEVSEVMKRRGFADKAEQKLPGLLGWITAMDVAATRRLWYACERWVKGETDIPVGSDAFYEEVARRYERVIQNTQPNFTVLQRSPALRSKNAAARIITMFGTQRMQNAGVFIESFAEVVQAKNKTQRKAALKKFGRSLSGMITAALVIGLERAIVAALRGRMKPLQDDDKDITVKSVSKYIMNEIGTTLAGSFMYVGEAYDFVQGIIGGLTEGDSGYETSFALPAAEALSTMIEFFRKKDWQYFSYMRGDHTDHEKWLKTRSFINELMTVVGYATGLPLANASKTILNGWVPLAQDISDAIKTGELNLYLHQSGKLDSSKTAANYKEWTNDGKKGSTYLYWEKQYKEIDSEKGKNLAEMLMRDSSLSAEDKAQLYRMLYGNDTVNDGTVVYHPVTDSQIKEAQEKNLPIPKHGNVAVDFTDASRYAASTELSDTMYDGFMELVADGVSDDLALVSFRQYAAQKKQGEGANDRFHDWLFKTISDPHERAIIDMHIIGSTNSVKGDIGYKDGEVYRDYSTKAWYDISAKPKQYKYAKELASSGLTDDKAIALIQQFKDVKKADSEQYLKGLTEAQIKLIYEFKGWKYE